MANCDDVKKNASQLGEEVESQENAINEKMEKEMPQPHYLKGNEGKSFIDWIGNYLVNKHGLRGDPWTRKEFREAIKAAFTSEESGGKKLTKKYGLKINAATLATEIIAMVNDKPWLQDIVNTMYWELLPEYRPFLNNNQGGEIDLATLPMSTLKTIYSEISYVASAQETGGNVSGLLGYFRIKLNVPTELAKHYGSEGYYNLAKSLSAYNERITYTINDFMKKPKELIVDGKKVSRNYGIENIFARIKEFAQEVNPKVIDEQDTEDGLVALFTRLSAGWMYIDDNGDLFINTEYKATGKQYESTGDNIFAFMNPVKIEDYSSDNKKLSNEVQRKVNIDSLGKLIKGIWGDLSKNSKDYIINGTKNKKGLMDLLDMYRTIDNQAGLFANAEVEKSANEIIFELSKMFKGVLDTKELVKIFFEKDYKKTDIYKGLSKPNKETLDMLYDLFSNQSMLKLVQMNATDTRDNPNFKQNHFPVQYFQAGLADMWNQSIKEISEELSRIEEELEVATGELRTQLMARKRSLTKSLFSLELTKQNWRDEKYYYDTQGDQNLPLAKDNKHIKHITGSFDIRNMRQDKGAYYSYLRHVASAIERNKLTAQLIRSLRVENRGDVRDNMINMYKGPFNRPDTNGGIFFWEGSPESYSRRLGSIGITISAKKIHHMLSITNAAVSGRYLSGIGTAVQNFSASAHAIQDYGIDRVVDSIKTLTNHKDSVYAMIDRSGIIDFSDYFSSSLINDLGGVDLENKVQETILGAMIQYHARIRNDKSAKTEANARLEFEQNIQRALEESRMFMDSIVIPDDIAEIEERAYERKYTKIKSMINKYVNWAITKRFEYNRAMKSPLFSDFARVSYDGLSRLATTVQYFYEFGPGQAMTMSETEKTIRTLSFIIGIKMAMDTGVIKRVAFDRIEGEDYKKAVEIGRIITRYTNYGMTTQDIGQIGQGQIGNSTVKFKIWWMQNMGKDAKRFKRVYNSLRDLSKIDDGRIDYKAVLKMVGIMGTSTKKLRTSNPAAAQLKSWFVMSGLFTLAATTMFGPLSLPVLGSAGRALGFETKYFGSLYSDSLAMFVIMPALFAFMALGDDELENEDWFRLIQTYIRKSFLGFGPVYTIELFLNMGRLFLDKSYGVAQYGVNLFSPFLMAPIIEKSLRGGAKGIDELMAE